MNSDLEKLRIYSAYVDMMFYFYKLTDKFPKHEKVSIASDIKRTLNDGIRHIINAQKCYSIRDRISYLNLLDCDLKVLKVYIRICYKGKYITSKNYGASCRKITNVNGFMIGWIRSC